MIPAHGGEQMDGGLLRFTTRSIDKINDLFLNRVSINFLT